MSDLSSCLIFGFGMGTLKITGGTTFNNVWLIDRIQTFSMSDSLTDPDFGLIINLKSFIGILLIGGTDPFQPNEPLQQVQFLNLVGFLNDYTV